MDERPGFGLYVHWPFCQSKCPYCDFNSHVSASVDHVAWREALASEIRRSAAETGSRVIDTIFFGGGTPSLMPPETVGAVIEAARSSWTASNDMEITLEANPTSVEAGRFQAYADAGVNRVSVGVQSLVEDDLRALGRLHSVEEARAAVATAQQIFPRVSFDLIYARQNQTLESWRNELAQALSMSSGHLSLYQLTIEPSTAFGDRFSKGSLRGLPDEDLGADMFDLTQDMTEAAGLPAYETSNHASLGHEARHNLIYWRSGEWVGVGPGAHGRLSLPEGRTATETHLAPLKWLAAVRDEGSGESLRIQLSPEDVREEAVLMGLRLGEGVSLDGLKNVKAINELTELGLIEVASDRVRLTRKGKPLLNAILRQLLT
ncbi:coproporphyrinogen III oxidase [Silicimonas algicola]|uniref:Heme chaperone HemW n=1 Tax=Silicimonas algicola TaxID=1826607 RepID=A0A316G6D4_9RHOB|nr:radical SAM family heme chaperone HemW [Silicimonas algicola]AZQ69444.1 coproporphyrinogen III oxidase [Silicimonas algicola]PWK56511.1 oxygen-independent coproporphyrinogen-3 oxidase [Silicimonas algicola]